MDEWIVFDAEPIWLPTEGTIHQSEVRMRTESEGWLLICRTRPEYAQQIATDHNASIAQQAASPRLWEVSGRLATLVWELDHGDKIEPGRVRDALEDWQRISRSQTLAPGDQP